MYPVIGEPPLFGATQLIITSSGLQIVVGAFGCAGTCAVRMIAIFENYPYPYAFLA
jgi:hypothetical protein